MFLLVGGLIALALGGAWVALWHGQVLGLLKGVLPLLLMMAGGMAIYYGIDEISYPSSKVPPAGLSHGPEPTEGPASRDA